MLKKLLQRVRCNYRLSIALLVVVFLLLGVIWLSDKASRESNARKSAEALQFENAPDGWLAHEKNVAECRKALNAGNLSAVGRNSENFNPQRWSAAAMRLGSRAARSAAGGLPYSTRCCANVATNSG